MNDHVEVGAVTYFSGSTAFGHGLWKTDGTQAGTVEMKYFGPSADQVPRNLVEVNGTILEADINPGPHGSSPCFIGRKLGRLFLVANDANAGREPFAQVLN